MRSASIMTPHVIHGWTVLAHPLFLDQLETLERQVETLRRKDPAAYMRKNAAKRLKPSNAWPSTSSRRTPPDQSTGRAEHSENVTGTGSAQSSFSNTGYSFAITPPAGSSSSAGSTTKKPNVPTKAQRMHTGSLPACSTRAIRPMTGNSCWPRHVETSQTEADPAPLQPARSTRPHAG